MDTIAARFIDPASTNALQEQQSPRVAPGEPGWNARVDRAFEAGQPIADVLRTSPRGAWPAFGVLLVALASAAVLATFCTGELPTRGPAALVSATGCANPPQNVPGNLHSGHGAKEPS